MARCIDADKLDFSPLENAFDRARAVTIVKIAPTADVKEVKRGYWKEHFANDCWYYDCPFCDDGFATKEKVTTPPNYCSNCGAKMDGERK